MRTVIWIPIEMYRKAILEQITGLPGAELFVVEDLKDLPAALAGAEVMISTGASKYTAAVAEVIRTQGTSLRWFQSVAAGNDGLMQHGMRRGVVVTGSGGHSAPVVAEHALTLLLSIAHAMPDLVVNKSRHVWGGEFKPRFKSLYGKTAVVIGLGNIGVEISRRLRAFGIGVIGVTRSGAPHEAADEVFATKDLRAALAKADAVLLSVPLTPETQHIIGAGELAALRPSSYVVNVSRGGLIDQAALLAALREGRIAGAAVDVTDPEPLPAGDPLWEAPNLIISPHCGGAGSTESPKRLAATVRRNLESFIAGGPLAHILTLETRAAAGATAG
jgi:phosphoglycerate dehydrogenase-like enzyme